MDRKTLFFNFLEKISSDNEFLLESIKSGFDVIFENTTTEQVEQIKSKLSINIAPTTTPETHSLDTLVPKEEDAAVEELKKLDELY